MWADIAVFTKTGTKDIFTYKVPENLSSVAEGNIVLVPFRKNNIQGLVIKVGNQKPPFKTKEIIRILQTDPVPLHLIDAVKYLSVNYHCDLGQAVTTVFPSNLQIKRRKIAEKIIVFSPKKHYKLTDEQTQAVDEINYSLANNQGGKFLLMGVTGSGKTEVYLQAIETAIKMNKDCIILVPEISLTPQTFQTIQNRFPNLTAMWHSQLKETERIKNWNDIIAGDKKIVVGSRSALFAPLKNLGLIIIDEEHETSYKQDQTPRYHAIDLARHIAKITNSTLVLGSATPSVESFKKALDGEYKKISLTKRISNNPLPKAKIVDLTYEFKKGNKSVISQELQESIQKSLKKNAQIVLFINRRGAATFILCRDCGFVFKCKDCQLPYTYHLPTNDLKCHHCEKKDTPPVICPKCNSPFIRFFGTGTQKVEQEAKRLFPSARIARMDKDSTKKRMSHENIYNDFKNKKIDILIGTQMIAKGWDIENVETVGVISADSSLNTPDFRAEERTLQLITQVAGRSGRKSGTLGEVIIQTYNPNARAITLAAENRLEDFYQAELKIREEFSYPPFVNIIKIMYNDKDAGKAFNKALSEKKELEKHFSVMGPLSSYLAKVGDKYRYLIIIKLKQSETENFINISKNKVSGTIDVNPQSLLG
jgi:primosomal protein N' (replication factor Y) (superfamily II helicase)